MAGRSAPIKIDDANWAERARLQCPRGHHWWEAFETTWYCRSCQRSYDEFVDTKTGDMVERADVMLKDGYRKR